jgi:hypothetical protein
MSGARKGHEAWNAGTGVPVIQKLLNRLHETHWPDPEKCWIWPGGTKGGGYGQIGEYMRGKRDRNYMVHRLSYAHFVGPIPSGHALDHRCLNKACFNPAHLDCVPFEENCFRGNRHERLGLLINSDGEKIPSAQLSLFDEGDAA